MGDSERKDEGRKGDVSEKLKCTARELGKMSAKLRVEEWEVKTGRKKKKTLPYDDDDIEMLLRDFLRISDESSKNVAGEFYCYPSFFNWIKKTYAAAVSNGYGGYYAGEAIIQRVEKACTAHKVLKILENENLTQKARVEIAKALIADTVVIMEPESEGEEANLKAYITDLRNNIDTLEYSLVWDKAYNMIIDIGAEMYDFPEAKKFYSEISLETIILQYNRAVRKLYKTVRYNKKLLKSAKFLYPEIEAYKIPNYRVEKLKREMEDFKIFRNDGSPLDILLPE